MLEGLAPLKTISREFSETVLILSKSLGLLVGWCTLATMHVQALSPETLIALKEFYIHLSVLLSTHGFLREIIGKVRHSLGKN